MMIGERCGYLVYVDNKPSPLHPFARFLWQLYDQVTSKVIALGRSKQYEEAAVDAHYAADEIALAEKHGNERTGPNNTELHSPEWCGKRK